MITLLYTNWYVQMTYVCRRNGSWRCVEHWERHDYENKKKELFFNLKENNYVEMFKTIHTHFIILWTVQKVCTYFMRYDMKRKVHTISPGIAGSQITFSLKLERKLLIENNERIDEDPHNLLVASHKYWQTTV